jgi:acyl phosphate:glycerol-3-phosphate acyltransferase
MSWFDHIGPFKLHPGEVGALVGYVLGCFTTGYYLVRWRTGQDIRELGSGSCGARNVGRQLGRTGFLLTLIGDFGKGAAAVMLTRWLTGSEIGALSALIGVVVGHIWPVQLRFHGGKGVAVSLGALTFVSFNLAVIYCLISVAGILLTRKSVISGLIAFALLPGAAYFLHHDAPHLTAISVLACIILTAHYRNVIQEINQLFPQREVDAQPKADSTPS